MMKNIEEVYKEIYIICKKQWIFLC